MKNNILTQRVSNAAMQIFTSTRDKFNNSHQCLFCTLNVETYKLNFTSVITLISKSVANTEDRLGRQCLSMQKIIICIIILLRIYLMLLFSARGEGIAAKFEYFVLLFMFLLNSTLCLRVHLSHTSSLTDSGTENRTKKSSLHS